MIIWGFPYLQHFVVVHDKAALIKLFCPFGGRRTPQWVDKPTALTNYDFIIACLNFQQTLHKHSFGVLVAAWYMQGQY